MKKILLTLLIASPALYAADQQLVIRTEFSNPFKDIYNYVLNESRRMEIEENYFTSQAHFNHHRERMAKAVHNKYDFLFQNRADPSNLIGNVKMAMRIDHAIANAFHDFETELMAAGKHIPQERREASNPLEAFHF